ncbi:Saccharopine dehydrogenase, NADP-dependent [Cyclobacterium lianum]|uniref:Saccharopine dehydrogenase, NADP-dependent n=1 Tax=Cyclobacterium lianum TaxID=388280 RepID=A0A1M7MD93_9BACT|nr:saccharopine dehydrogenase NADP-binding domain-containing protein [Cyclobacterium lianum]SHM88707.1 Saccharopine dehydrogenase, NADP-dependent [Cyclobacterium lianum]
MKDDIDRILIIGGYGRAGKSISRLLASYDQYEIITAGRTLAKAQKQTEHLQNEFPGGVFKAMEVDINNRKKLTDIIREVQLVIVAVPLDYQNSLSLIDAVLNSKNAHHIDLSPGKEKHLAFNEMKEAIEEWEHLFLLDAGFEPGLPGFMARWALCELDKPEKLLIEGVYHDPEIPDGGIKDIIGHNEPAYIVKNGTLKKACPFKMKIAEFPQGFGKAISVPIWMPELQSIPSKYNLKNMAYYHAGINGLANIIMLSWQMIFNKFLPMNVGVSLFRWAIQNFTKKPYGGVIRVTAENSHLKREITNSHNELYEATAIPVVTTARLILKNEPDQFGFFFMGEWVPKNDFLHNLQALGMKVSVKNEAVEGLFNDYKHHLNALDEDIRWLALKYAEEFYVHDKCTKAEAIDRAIAKAEMEKRNL